MRNELTLKELQMEGYKMLELFAEVCDKHKFCYSLGYGTLLGAVRCSGFLPWDDDVDVFMPRPDYDRLIELSSTEVLFGRDFDLIYKENGTFDGTYAKLINKKICIEHTSLENYVSYFFIDINPIDGIPQKKGIFLIKIFMAEIWKKICFMSKAKLGIGEKKINRMLKYILKPIAKVIGPKRCLRQISGLYKDAKYENADVVGGIVEPDFKGLKECFPKKEFEELILMKFEGNEFPVMSCYNSFLRGKFGDNYMTFQKKEQINKHFSKAWRED